MNSKLAIPASFRAFVIREKDRGVSAAFEPWSLDQLDAGEVVLRVSHSSVNYKDALAATGRGRIIRRFPCIGGIDLAGTVVSSSDPRFAAGDPVLATSFDIGVAHHGGYAEYARLPAAWAKQRTLAAPDSLSTSKAKVCKASPTRMAVASFQAL